MLEKLQAHSPRAGARAIILAPTRELALQTHKAVRELAKFTDLRTAVLVGGDSMEAQFAELAQNPDIIVATPGACLGGPGGWRGAVRVGRCDRPSSLWKRRVRAGPGLHGWCVLKACCTNRHDFILGLPCPTFPPDPSHPWPYVSLDGRCCLPYSQAACCTTLRRSRASTCAPSSTWSLMRPTACLRWASRIRWG